MHALTKSKRRIYFFSFAIVTAIFLTDARMHSRSILFLPYKTIRAFTCPRPPRICANIAETRVKPTCPVAARSGYEPVIESDNGLIKNILRSNIFITLFSSIVLPRYINCSSGKIVKQSVMIPDVVTQTRCNFLDVNALFMKFGQPR